MRPFAVTLALALLSLAFAPAPFPKADRQTPQQQAMRECVGRLEELGVSWHVESRDGRSYVNFTTHRPESRLGGGLAMVSDGDLLATLQRVVKGRHAEHHFRSIQAATRSEVTSRQAQPTPNAERGWRSVWLTCRGWPSPSSEASTT